MEYLSYWLSIGIVVCMFRMALTHTLLHNTADVIRSEFNKGGGTDGENTYLMVIALVMTIFISIILWPIMLVSIIVKLLR